MESVSAISDRLSIPKHHCRCLSKTRIVCIVTNDWYKCLRQGKVGTIPATDIFNPTEAERLLAASSISLPESWLRIAIKVVKKQEELVERLRIDNLHNGNIASNIFEHLVYVAHENFNTKWKTAHHLYLGSNNSKHKKELQRFSASIYQYVDKFKPDIYINLDSTGTILPLSSKRQSTPHPNLVPLSVLIETASHFFFVQPYVSYTLHNIVFFSPSVLSSSTANSLFIVYQLLHAMHCLHQHGISAKGIKLSNILINQNLWISLTTPQIKTWMIKAREESKELLVVSKNCDVLEGERSPERRFRASSEREELVSQAREVLKSCTYKQYTIKDLPSIVDRWVCKKLTNFEYLMILNHLAGRVMNDPNNHPVLPWVKDFTTPEFGHRDLTMSKYRINKGDYQLDFTYNSMIGMDDNGEHIPHHVSDVLSDITYYVYKARRTEKSILCTHVRTNWVPHEYPSSMQRMQEWTPDECIPEFYTDPTIFVSIHEDLPDLEIPQWCSSAYDFILKHMAALESDIVSEMLHHWIDLTFGYKLTGAAAVKSKNVYLQLVDNHKSISNHGVVQLFTEPHPHKLSTSQIYSSLHPPKIPREVLPAQMMMFSSSSSGPETVVHELSSMEIVDLVDKTRPESAVIHLPKNYNILQPLDDYESQFNFSSKSLLHLPATQDQKSKSYLDDEVRDILTEDLAVFICNMCEIFLSPKVRALGPNLSNIERYKLIRSICSSDCEELPRPLRKATGFLFKNLIIDESSEDKKLFRYLSDNEEGIPLPSPSYLLQPYSHILPFPEYFDKLYTCLTEIKQKDAEIEKLRWSKMTPAEKNSMTKCLQREKIPLLEQFLTKYHNKLGQEGLDILSPYIEELFENEITTVQAAWCFLNTMSRELGKVETAKRLLPHLIKLFSGENSTAKHVKLYHRQFLMQLIVRLGLKTFILNFSTLLVEAVSGFKDFYVPSKFYNEELLEEMDQEELTNTSPNWDPNMAMNRSPNELNIEQPNEFSFQTSYSWETGKDESTQADVDEIEDDFPDNMSLEDEEEEENRNIPRSVDSTSVGKMSMGSEDSENQQSVDEENSVEDDAGVFGSVASIHSISHLLEQSRDKLSSIDESNTGLLNEDNPNVEYRGLVSDTESHDEEDENPKQFYLTAEGGDETLTPKRKESMVRSETEDLMMNISISSPTDILNIRDVATESVKWLCHKLGPVLTAKHLSRNLIRMISLCYMGEEQLRPLEKTDNYNLKSSKLIVGDTHSHKILECLGFVAELYGEQVILLQYLPCIVDLVSVCQKRLTHRSETGLFGALLLLRYIIPFLSNKTLMDVISDVFVKDTLIPIIKLVTSPSISFPGGSLIRSVISHKIIDVLYVIGLRLGFEMTRTHLNQPMQLFFDAFNFVHGKNSANNFNLESTSPSVIGSQGSEEGYLTIKMDSTTREYKIGTPVSVSSIHMAAQRPKHEQSSKYHSLSSINLPDEREELNSENKNYDNKEGGQQELANVFTPELALAAYVPICGVFGGIHMECNLYCDDLMRQLCSQQDQTADQHLQQSDDTIIDDGIDTLTSVEDCGNEVLGGIGRNVAMIGNRIQLTESVETTSSTITELGRNYRHSGILSIYPDDLMFDNSETYKGRHLRGNWLAYWEHELGLHERDTSFNFKQIKLQTFVGHTNSIRSLHVIDVLYFISYQQYKIFVCNECFIL
ncbi:WD repeat-containing protein 81 [Patella vulgata]|uniref:WD repeat-containing protein 81 n=1 Tax=Patella vulgata TaxID=6465 RepID=UPI0024A7E814|nr:WD repeat-containing protein 81 [Patella vulgata]